MVLATVALAMCLLLSVSFNCLLMRSMYKAHRDECMRLMCKDVHEYKAMTDDTEKAPAESAHQKAIRAWREKGKH